MLENGQLGVWSPVLSCLMVSQEEKKKIRVRFSVEEEKYLKIDQVCPQTSDSLDLELEKCKTLQMWLIYCDRGF